MSKGKLGSMAYQVSRAEIDLKKCSKHGTGDISPQTAKQYKKHAIQFAEWCKAQYGVKVFADCRTYIQAYSDVLTEQGKSESTCHTYLAAVCRYFGVPLGDINKRKRICAHHTRSRGVKAVDSRADAKREASPRLFDLAEMVGVRRAEYLRLDGSSLVCDESGYPCVRIDKGKGGKFQLQRLLPEDVDKVGAYFDTSDCLLFTAEEMKNKIDLHALRGEQARRAYAHYLKRIESEGRGKLVGEIAARWQKYCDKPWNEAVVREKPYFIRGANKQLAIEHDLPTVYDRLALMAVSVFHLAHWRLDVTVSNYMLAV